MILISRKFTFKTALVILEDDKALELYRTGKFSAIRFMSYEDKDVPGFVKTSKTTALIDLVPPPEAIYARFSEREKIAKTYKEPRLEFANEAPQDRSVDAVGLASASASACADAYKAYREFEYSQGRAPVSRREFSMNRLFVARYDGKTISGISVMQGGRRLRIRSIFSKRLSVPDKDMYRIIANSSRRLMWEICQWGHQSGFVSLDMASVNLTDPSKKGISDFKMSFGGTVVNEYTYAYKSKLFSSLEFIAAARARLRSRLHRILRPPARL